MEDGQADMKTSINLVGQEITHFSHGDGVVVEQTPSCIKVKFYCCSDPDKQFLRYSLMSPDTFRKFLKCRNYEIQRSMLLRDIGDLPLVVLDGIEWWREAPRQWLNIGLIHATNKLHIDNLERLYKQLLRKRKLDELSDIPVAELLSRATTLRAEIKAIQVERRGNSTNDSVKAKAHEGIDYIEAALSRTGNITDAEIRGCLPMLSAFYRNVGESARCYTDIYKKYKDRDVFSGKFYVSLAAAYCDMGDADGALKTLDIAHSHGESANSIHSQRVYERIQAILNERDGF